MKKIFLILFTSTFFLSNCGFKLANVDNNYNIANVNIDGDKQVNFKLKNKLLIGTDGNKENIINLNINTKVEKLVKEKSISNQITKYEIKLTTNVDYEAINKKNKGIINIIKNADFNVAGTYTDTINREKNIINTLIEKTAEEIKENLALYFNDF